jgi:DNA relaxase NicK
MRQYRYGVHWLSFVVIGTKENAFTIYKSFFKDLFGELQSIGHGGRGFEEIWHSYLEFKVYVSPRRKEIEYFHFEIPGQACECIPWQLLHDLEIYIKHEYPDEYHYTRLDLAFDEMPFSPQDVEDAIRMQHVRSLAKKETLTIYKTPFGKKDNGEIGTHTVEFGSRMSERMIRVYNRRADLVAKQIFNASDVSEWWPIMISHLRDYIDFNHEWWNDFVNGIGRARAIVSSPKDKTAESMTRWLEKSVAVTLSVIHDMRLDYFLKDLITQGRMKRGNRYDLLLTDAQIKIDFYDELGRRVWKKADEEDEKEEGENE